MAKLSVEEQEALDKLTAKLEAPDDTPANSSEVRNIHIDLSDEEAVKRAQGLGLLGAFKDLISGDDTDTDDTDSTDDKDTGRKPDKAPKRNGFFGDEK